MTQELIIVPEHGSFTVKDTGDRYPSDSVLAGQTMVKFVDSFDTLEEAQQAYPDAQLTHALLQPQNSVNHLPDDSDY